MSLFTKLANDAFSPVDAAGNKRAVENIDAQRWGTEVERLFTAFQAGGGIIFPDLAAAGSSLDYAQNQMAWVIGDSTAANNGIYRKTGASGSGSWVRAGDLPYSMIPLTNAGAGTADAIVATSALPIPVTPGATLFTVNIVAENTGPVTINSKPLRTNSGNEIVAGGLTAGSVHAFIDLGDHYRLLSDQASASIVAAAEGWAIQAGERADDANNAADRAEGFAAMQSADKVRFATVPLLLADTLMSYTDDPGKIHVGPGDVIEAGGFRYEVASSGASGPDIVENANGVKLYPLRSFGRLFAEAFGLVPDDEGAAATNKAIWNQIRAATTAPRGSQIVDVGNATYFFSLETDLAAPGMVLQGDATFKLGGENLNTQGFLIRAADGFRMSGITFDGNRAAMTNMGMDRALVLITNIEDVLIDRIKVHGSRRKGLAVAAGVSGKGVSHVTVKNSEGWDCGEQVFMTDRSNLVNNDTIPCKDIVFKGLTVGDTDHAGIAINDGSLRVKVLNCHVDNNNAVWHAIAVRGSRQTLVQGCTGRRGLCGFQALVLDNDAVLRGEVLDGLTLIGNLWENNKQSGCQIGGGLNWSVTGDHARNNGQGGGEHFGFVAVSRVGVQRAQNGSFNGVHAYDDQAVPTQHTAIGVVASDNVKVVSPVMHGNSSRNRVHYSDVTGFEVIGDGPDGATRKKVSVTTGELASSAAVNVSIPFVTPFAIAPNSVMGAVSTPTSGAAIVLENIHSVNTVQASVRVRNTGAAPLTGTIHLTAEYIS